MKTWVITGGVACGKSFVQRELASVASQKTAVFSADVAVQEILKRVATLEILAVTFGPEVLSSEGVNRAWLRDQILPIAEKREVLEAILHPQVLADLEAARTAAQIEGMNLFLAEVPLHYEIGEAVSADFVIVVASSQSVQVRRMTENRGLDEQTVQHFLVAQWPVEAKVERADVVIWNDGSLASLQAQVLTLASQLLQHESSNS